MDNRIPGTAWTFENANVDWTITNTLSASTPPTVIYRAPLRRPRSATEQAVEAFGRWVQKAQHEAKIRRKLLGPLLVETAGRVAPPVPAPRPALSAAAVPLVRSRGQAPRAPR